MDINNNKFVKHHSEKLLQLYDQKSYQGADPHHAKILFVGKDPNWADNIDQLAIFELVTEYLSDGIAFWKKYNIHHPFLHSSYKNDGKKYHQAVSRINLPNDLSENISFIEIIGFPTRGMSSTNDKQFKEYLMSIENRKHLVALDILFNSSEKIIFLYWGLLKIFKEIYRKLGLFKKLAEIDQTKMIRTDLNKFDNFYIHKHFSMGISQSTLNKINKVVIENLN